MTPRYVSHCFFPTLRLIFDVRYAHETHNSLHFDVQHAREPNALNFDAQYAHETDNSLHFDVQHAHKIKSFIYI